MLRERVLISKLEINKNLLRKINDSNNERDHLIFLIFFDERH